MFSYSWYFRRDWHLRLILNQEQMLIFMECLLTIGVGQTHRLKIQSFIRLPSLQTPALLWESPGLPLLWPTGYSFEGPLLVTLIIHQNDSQNSGKYYTYKYSFIILKVILHELEEMHRLEEIQTGSFHHLQGHGTLSAMMGSNSNRLLPVRDAHPSFGIQNFYWGFII